MMPRRLALVGAECSGKTTLATALARELPAHYVPEVLREFVDSTGRSPTKHEQHMIMAGQINAERVAYQQAAISGVPWVCADPCPLMTAVYSIEYFNDESLLPPAVRHQQTYDLTLWCDVDLPWVPDGAQRDGPQRRLSVDRVIASVVADFDLSVVRVHGGPDERLCAALAAVEAVRTH